VIAACGTERTRTTSSVVRATLASPMHSDPTSAQDDPLTPRRYGISSGPAGPTDCGPRRKPWETRSNRGCGSSPARGERNHKGTLTFCRVAVQGEGSRIHAQLLSAAPCGAQVLPSVLLPHGLRHGPHSTAATRLAPARESSPWREVACGRERRDSRLNSAGGRWNVADGSHGHCLCDRGFFSDASGWVRGEGGK
jgi:hypothetical protein